jgi:ferrochelatase
MHTTSSESLAGFDALLILSFGGPEGMDDVEPFLDNVFRGLRVTPETKQKIAARYALFGGVSPIAGETRALVTAVRQHLATAGRTLPVYLGNRNWHPMLVDTVRQMRDDGVRRALVFVTSTFSSYSGCRKYREDLFEACRLVEDAPQFAKLRMSYNHPGFIAAVTARCDEMLAQLPEDLRSTTPLLFTAHSLPNSMANGCDYVAQLRESCRLVAESLSHNDWELVFQSNNASYGGEKWLEPDVFDAIRRRHTEGFTRLLVMPIGFLCDHMEVVLDLDIDAAELARELGVQLTRAKTVGVHPKFVSMIGELIDERLDPTAQQRVLGDRGVMPDRCRPGCCPSGRGGPMKPALCGSDPLEGN